MIRHQPRASLSFARGLMNLDVGVCSQVHFSMDIRFHLRIGAAQTTSWKTNRVRKTNKTIQNHTKLFTSED